MQIVLTSFIWRRHATAFVVRTFPFHRSNNGRSLPLLFSSQDTFSWRKSLKPLSFSTSSKNYHDRNNNDDIDDDSSTLTMENIYTAWTVDDDKILYENINKPIHKVASLLGRGLNGVVSRKNKLKDVNSKAYKRLFVGGQNYDESGTTNSETNEKKLVPVLEVLRRIKWDVSLNSHDFTVKYFDRVDEKIYSCSFDQNNDSVKGKEEMFVFALPEHRIQSILFKDRVVWDKETRLDCVFGSMNGKGETIYDVIENYHQWKEEEIQREEFNKRRQQELANQIRSILGDDLFLALRDMSKGIQEKATLTSVTEQDVTLYVNGAMGLFRKANLSLESNSPLSSSSSGSNNNEIDLLNIFSDLVALLPNVELREMILLNIYQLIRKIENEKSPKKAMSVQLEALNEDELIETFVKGSGAGGQKINKTANRVVLVHEPTQIRVECQDTRSLQQNRKIARKRMQLKLDQYYNGVSSRTEMKIAKKINKKAKAKTRNKARQRKKKEATATKKE